MINISKETKNKEFKKLLLGLIVIGVICISLFSGCTQKTEGLPIVLVGRDSTSGTREFFFSHVMNSENFSETLQEKNSNGGIYQTISQTPGAIGYVGLGFLNTDVKALKINNISATVANVLAGTYPISRDLYMFTKGEATGAAKEFIEYIQSSNGQAIVEEEGFVPLVDSQPYNSSGKTVTGSLKIGGSTTVFPIAEKAKESFSKIYSDVSITISSTGSGAGITAVGQDTVDIGMSSRDLKSSESSLGLVKYIIAKDGIAIIVNPENTYVDTLTLEQLKAIYKGDISNWNEFI